MGKMNVYEIVTQRIIEKLEKGVVPWKLPFSSFPAVNWSTGHKYRGINTLLLEPGEYATFNQIKKAGGTVKKGEKSNIVVFWKWIAKEDEETGEEISFPMLRYYRVFEINSQVKGLKSKRKEEKRSHNPIIKAEKLLKRYKDKPKITSDSGRAYYKPSRDIVNIPPLNDFDKPEWYYSVMFHELVHSTGSKSRLNRKGVVDFDRFGSQQYSEEELIAEIGASMLNSLAGIESETIENSASYIDGWLRKFKDDNRFIIFASQQAQKAVDYMIGAVDGGEEIASN